MNKSDADRNSRHIRILLVISLIAVIAFVVFMIWNPAKTAEDARNKQRSTDISYILDKVTSYTKKNGKIPDSIPVDDTCGSYGNEICVVGLSDCKNYVDLSLMIENNPVDPLKKSAYGTGYYISQDDRGNIIVCAPYAERSANIVTTKFAF